VFRRRPHRVHCERSHSLEKWETNHCGPLVSRAEFINLTPSGVTLLWLAQLLEQAGYPQEAPQSLFTDSKNAEAIALNPYNNARIRNIYLRYKWVIFQIKKGSLRLEHVGTVEMIADGLTKPLNAEKHANFVRQLRLEYVGACLF